MAADLARALIPPATIAAPMCVVEMSLESRPRIKYVCASQEDAVRLEIWLARQPGLRAIIETAHLLRDAG